MSNEDAREAAWGAVHEALPAGWRVGPASIGDPLRGTWSVTALRRPRGRLATPQTVTGTGADEVSALRDLDDRLRGVPKPDGTAMDALRRRLRLAYVEGAEDWAREELRRSWVARSHYSGLSRLDQKLGHTRVGELVLVVRNMRSALECPLGRCALLVVVEHPIEATSQSFL
jgi:hypothetical protein